MDHSTFDAVARAVAAGASRRQVLRLLAIGAVTAWLPGRAGAAPARQPCEAAGLTDCGTGCVDLWSDAFNCGSCGIACPSGVCQGGTCSSVQLDIGCVLPTVDCGGGGCIDISSDPNQLWRLWQRLPGAASVSAGPAPRPRSISAASHPSSTAVAVDASTCGATPSTVAGVASPAPAVSVRAGPATRSARYRLCADREPTAVGWLRRPLQRPEQLRRVWHRLPGRCL